jgi:ABC-type polysaccharide/polyol phosphate export permease
MAAPLTALLRQRELILTLVGREMKTRYRGSVLGYCWSFLNPLLLLAVYTVVFSTVFQPRVAGVTPFALFLFVGLLPWTWFAGCLTECTTVFADNAQLMKKVPFAPEVLPVVKVLAHGLHFVLALPVVLAALAFTGHLRWTAVLLVIPMAVELLALAGLGLLVSAASVYFRDLKDLLTNLLHLLFFATPIVYVLEMLPAEWMRTLIRLNPLTHLLRLWQDTLFFGRVPSAGTLLAAAGFALAALALGLAAFAAMRENLAERL